MNLGIEHTTIAYAGGDSGISSYDCALSGDTFSNHGAVVFHGQQPASVLLTGCRIEHSARDGVVRGWTGDPLDFTATLRRCRALPTDLPQAAERLVSGGSALPEVSGRAPRSAKGPAAARHRAVARRMNSTYAASASACE